MSERKHDFCKIHQIDEFQVLVLKSAVEGSNNPYSYKVIIQVAGYETEMEAQFDTAEKRDKAFNAYSKDKAKKLLGAFLEMIRYPRAVVLNKT